jgi:HD-like signal output (HDOD) protein
MYSLIRFHGKKAVVNSVTLVSQALLKPMDSAAVIAAIEKCLAISNLPKTIRGKLISVGSLPGASLADEELTKISKNPQAGQSEFAQFVISNPFLVARIIRIANSPFFGEQMHKLELMEAMRIVGTAFIKDLIEIGNSEHPEHFPSGVPSDYYRVINDSLEIAILCGEIMKEICIEKGDYEDAKILGLLSLIGRLVFYALDAEKSTLILEQEELPIEAEKAHFGIDYATVSATLMSLWGMPDYVTDAILHHLQPSNSPYPSDLLVALHLAHHVKGLKRPYGKISSGFKLDHEFLAGSKIGSSYKRIVERFYKV